MIEYATELVFPPFGLGYAGMKIRVIQEGTKEIYLTAKPEPLLPTDVVMERWPIDFRDHRYPTEVFVTALNRCYPSRFYGGLGGSVLNHFHHRLWDAYLIHEVNEAIVKLIGWKPAMKDSWRELRGFFLTTTK